VLPSTSSICDPLPRVTNSGVAATDLNARTGLSTPPGRIRDAASNSRADFGVRRARIIFLVF
jgi:hypothetical protein